MFTLQNKELKDALMFRLESIIQSTNWQERDRDSERRSITKKLEKKKRIIYPKKKV